jgi:hypothetical protein
MVKKAVLIGAEGYRSTNPDVPLDCFPWKSLGRVQNLSDYDTVILNVLSTPQGDQVDWHAFAAALNLETMTEILGHEGTIIVLGDPRFDIQSKRPGGQQFSNGSAPFLSWSGLTFEWDARPGTSVHFQWGDVPSYDDRRRFRDYLLNLNKWDYSLRSFELNQSHLSKIVEHYLPVPIDQIGRENIRPRVEPGIFCTTRFHGILSGSFRIAIDVRRDPHGWTSASEFTPFHEFGPLVLLPSTSLDEDESLRVILRDACEIETVSPEPSWAIDMIAPGQDAIDVELHRLHAEIEEQVERYHRKETERAAIRRPLRLLFAQHEDLEDAVREAFAALGAVVDLPDERNREDGLLTVCFNGREAKAVLEVKGREKDQFDERGLRQLQQWILPRIEQGETYKGIFVGNAAIKQPLQKRPNPFGG